LESVEQEPPIRQLLLTVGKDQVVPALNVVAHAVISPFGKFSLANSAAAESSGRQQRQWETRSRLSCEHGDLPAQQARVFVYDWLKHGAPSADDFRKARAAELARETATAV